MGEQPDDSVTDLDARLHIASNVHVGGRGDLPLVGFVERRGTDPSGNGARSAPGRPAREAGVRMNGDHNRTGDGSDVTTVRLSDEGRRFAELSAVLTGFEPYDLLATGMADLYLGTARAQVGATVLDAVLSVVERDLDALSGTELEVARALTYLWYTGAWPRLAPEAHGLLRREAANVEFIVSPDAYTEGLVWRTFNGHPAGAKAPGFATWALQPPPLSWPEPPVPVAAPGPRLRWSDFPSALPPSIFSPAAAAAPSSEETPAQ